MSHAQSTVNAAARHAMAAAAALLLITTVRHYGYDWAPVQHQPVASKGLGGAALLAQAWVIYALIPSRVLLPVVLFVTWQELQVVLCSAAYIQAPWPVPPGQGLCSARAGFDIGAASIIATAFLARWLAVKLHRRDA